MSAPSVLFDAPGPRMRRLFFWGNVLGVVVVLGILALVLSRFAANGQFAWRLWEPLFAADTWRYYVWPGLRNTLLAAAISIVTSMVFGLIFGLGRLSQLRVIRWFCGTIVEFFRAVPVLIMMTAFWLFLLNTSFVSTQVIPTRLYPLYAVVAGLTLYNGSVIAELVRSGVHNLPRGQREAAAAIGMTHGQSLRIVELPQALVAMLPSLVSQFVVILKDTALGYIITFPELLSNLRRLGSGGLNNILQTLLLAVVIFVILNYALSRLAELLARKLSARTADAITVEAAGYVEPVDPAPPVAAPSDSAGIGPPR